MRKSCYIAGPMRGIKWFNFPAFDTAYCEVSRLGYDPVSPADIDRKNGFDPHLLPEDHDWNVVPETGPTLAQVVDRDIKAVLKCDAIYLLKGWEKSTGARAEYAVARFKHAIVMLEPGAADPSTLYVPDQQMAMQTPTVKPDDWVTPLSEPKPTEFPEGSKDSNPKDVIGSRKPSISCIPCAPLFELGAALQSGGLKYGAHNWRAIGVRASVYYNAAMRHIMSWWEGEDSDPESQMPHLAHAAACLFILRDSELKENMTDDRPLQSVHPYQHIKDTVEHMLDNCTNPKKPYTQIPV